MKDDERVRHLIYFMGKVRDLKLAKKIEREIAKLLGIK